MNLDPRRAVRQLAIGIVLAGGVFFGFDTRASAESPTCCAQCSCVQLCCQCGIDGGGCGSIEGYGCFYSCPGDNPNPVQFLCSEYCG